jgi:hypothetical protein
MYIPEHFTIQELLPKSFYNNNKHRMPFLWSIIFDERLLRVIDAIREDFGPMKCCDWSYGGKRNWSGFRPPSCGIGATLSQHRFGRAVDLLPMGDITPDEIRDEIIKAQNDITWKDIGGLEMNITWLHIDVRSRDTNGQIQLFYP